MKKHTLAASIRTMLGRKAKALRRQGQLPATVYGKNVKSVSVAVDTSQFEKLYAQVGETGLVELRLDDQMRPVLINRVQMHPVTRAPLHIEFHHVDLAENVKANVPVELVGEAAAVAAKKGVLLTILDEVEVEALPTNIPQKIELDIANLAEVDQELKVRDLKVPHGVTIVTDSQQTLVKVGSLVSKEAEAEAAQEAKAAEAAAAQTAQAPAAEGEAPQEAPTPSEKEVVAEKSDTDQEK